MGMVERHRSFPSDRASAEFLSYYEGLYQEKGPDPAQFRALLRRNGPPFLSNPFPEGMPEHYLYHPDGLIMADLEAVLGGLAQHWEKLSDRDAQCDAKEQEDSAYVWPTIFQADRARQLEILATEGQWSRVAGVCWAMVLLEAKSMDWLRARVHSDNLAWATVQSLRSSPLEEWKLCPASVLSAAVDHGVLPARVAAELFPQWMPSETEQSTRDG